MYRRQFLTRSMAAAGSLVAAPTFAIAELAMGDATLTTVSDGTLLLPRSFTLAGLPEAEAGRILEANGVTGDQLTPPCNVTLYRDGTNTVLFDVGSGDTFMPTAGTLLDSLDAIGVTADDITHVVFTHGHPDHLWGLLDDFGDIAFANAAFHMGQAEWDYWTNPETVNTIDAERQAFAVGAARRLEALADQIALFDGGDTVLPGIEAVATYGHTPGHMSFALDAGGQQAFIIGDAIGNHHVSFAHPEWQIGSDQDPATGAATRTALMDRLAVDDTTVVGFHLPEGGIGRVERSGDGYRFAPLDG
ncbi:MBL fold metallo-hydrolase [Anianabacter salinae]|uniref:MBL fold metallo-hydrolase n=1 Tax=Anianabacter salinae TaxID=2851023 RepID=UPI00225DE88A|nr:MBL fold metallo-hydrolase [Anianabacter salinae]MBV0912781.1 MBL fold metallo-hydrolase [Anianabacter salinae]